MWRRRAWFRETGLTLEQVEQLHSEKEIWEAETYWQIEHMIVNSNAGSASMQKPEDTEAAYQAMKQKAQTRGGE